MSRCVYPQSVREIQPRGIMLDETEAGYSRVIEVDSSHAFTAFLSGTYNTSLQGTATVSQQYFAEGNPFGTLDGLLVTVPPGAIAPATASSVTSVGTVATFNTATPHGFPNNCIVTVTGATPSAYNVANVQITVTSATQFTYPFAGGTSPATGTIVATPAAQSATIYFQFSGRSFSLAWDRYRGSNPLPVSGWADGKFFSLDNTIKDVASAALGTSSAGSMYRNIMRVPLTLKDDGPHQCKLHFPMDLAGGVQRQWLLYGFGSEMRFGNINNIPSSISRYLSLTTSFQSIGAQGSYAFGIKGLQFANNTAGAVNVTIERDGNTYPAINIAANSLYTYDFLDYIKVSRSSSSGTGVIRVKTDTAGTQMYIIQRTL